MQQLLEFVEYLRLEKPVDLRIKMKYNPAADAEYKTKYSGKTGEIKGHKITIWLSEHNGRSFEALLAHELIHALMCEMGIGAVDGIVHHDDFIDYATRMERVLYIENIYIALADTD